MDKLYFNLITFFFLFVAFLIFQFVAKDDILSAVVANQNDGFRLYADHPTYVNAYESVDNLLELLIIKPNYLGPVITIGLLQNNLYFIFIFNVILFIISVSIIRNHFKGNWNIYLVLLVINPILIVSLFSANKEIYSLLATNIFIIALDKKKIRYLIISVVVGLFSRKELSFFFIVMFVLFNIKIEWYNYKLVIISLFVISITMFDGYISANFDAIEQYLIESESTINQTNTRGTIYFLNEIQRTSGYFLVFIPKILLNIFGTIYRLDLLLDFSDMYNNHVIWGQSLLFIFIIPVTYIKVKKTQIRIINEIFFSFLIFCILFAFVPIVQNRYFYPCYVLLSGLINITIVKKEEHILREL
jgi:hypothetical protein